ncbi:MAG: hypothetical protein JO138_16300 [Acidobacteriaceae bacterium]|nr:hypothetical protein [Acidobacteriaceae bacterium]
MSLQVFLQAQLLGTEEFLASGHSSQVSDDASELTGRCAWLTLLCEVLPRALLAELKLSRMLLGSSSAEQFLLVLAEDDLTRANAFLARTAEAVSALSGNTVHLVWASTENLGAWPVVRRRLDDTLAAKLSARLGAEMTSAGVFSPFVPESAEIPAEYFVEFGRKLPGASAVGWSPDSPAHLTYDEGQYTWTLKEEAGFDDDGIVYPRRLARKQDGTGLASPSELARQAEGTAKWAILRGDVDHFDIQLRRAATIEDHLHLSVAFKEFFAGELALSVQTIPDLFGRLSVLYREGDGFAVLGAWDALLVLAREMQRLFEKFIQHNFESMPGVEAKTISMGLAIAPDPDTHPAALFREAGLQVAAAKATEVGSFNLFGRTIEWKRLSDAEEVKTGLVRMVREFGYSPDMIRDLASIYREAFTVQAGRRNKAVRVDKPWRTYMRVSGVIPLARNKDMNNARNAVITSLVGKRTSGMKLRPSGRVGLEWARIAAGE